jgi:S-adenosylmethionine:tRNA ribosyltransferase-isomerase
MTFNLDDYNYELPSGLIAQEPAKCRGESRLMVVNRPDQSLTEGHFGSLDRFLPEGALVVLNNAKVTPARLLGRREGGAGRVELLILEPPLSPEPGEIDCECLGKPGRQLKPGAELVFGNAELSLRARVMSVREGSGRRLVRFDFPGRPLSVLESLGHMPLPPYIKRLDREEDFERYQTVYAKNPGAIAAPTAGLHFTAEILGRLKERHEVREISLMVGAGTFAPLTVEQLRAGRLHEEQAEVSEETALAVREAKRQKRRIVAIGTTTARALEWAAEGGDILPRKGPCGLFIRPGYQFKAIGALVTNFHLPRSSLLLLVGAFMGQLTLKKAYGLAIERGYSFYSYGDAMLIL